ncbi:hypothetical protein MBLNU13_g03377t1 [Cladosporium sp. NU13]
MPSTASFKDPKVYHILTYGTLLGSNLFQTFLGGPLAFKALPRPSFSTLQQAIFPPYFTFQAALPILLALTWPGEKLAQVGGRELTQNSGFWGILSENNLMTAGMPVFLMFATSAANLLVFGPATTKVMKERKHQETRDGKKYYDPGEKSPEMKRLNASFGKLHGISSALNLLGTFAMLYYGATLAELL